ncbi:MAG: DUF805 domain-containing protein [Alphaproteobacteria bacterium]
MNLEKLKKGFNDYFVNVVKTQYTNIKGRATRSQYWYYVLCYFIVSLPFAIVDALFNMRLFSTILGLALLVPSISIGIRRLHDINKSGWWYLIALIPIAGPIALLVMFCLPTQNAAEDTKSNQKKAA